MRNILKFLLCTICYNMIFGNYGYSVEDSELEIPNDMQNNNMEYLNNNQQNNINRYNNLNIDTNFQILRNHAYKSRNNNT